MLNLLIIILLLMVGLTLFGCFCPGFPKTKKHTSTKHNPTSNLSPTEKLQTSAQVQITTKTLVMPPNSDPLTIPDVSGRVRFHQYKVRGKNPLTNRLKTITVVVPDDTSEEDIIAKSGLFEPITITLDTLYHNDNTPTEKQINYARDLDIPHPESYSLGDLSCLISKQTGEDSKDLASEGLRKYAADYQFFTSPYCGSFKIICCLVHTLTDEEVLTFWCYFVYCLLALQRYDDLRSSPYFNVFNAFGVEHSHNVEILSIMRSLDEGDIKKFFTHQKIDRRFKSAKVYLLAKQHLIANNIWDDSI